MENRVRRKPASNIEAAQFPQEKDVDPTSTDQPLAWELVDAELGRYMPRRIRGSFRGRALG
jgi:hypothetical protein